MRTIPAVLVFICSICLASAQAPAYDGQRRNAFKANLFSPVFDHISVSYERSLKPGRSYELSAGLIGIGNRLTAEKSTGYFGRAGFKLILIPEVHPRRQRTLHLLKGLYAKPELVMGAYNMHYTGYHREVVMGGALVNAGYQWVFSNAWIFDAYFGLGYGFATYSNNTVTSGTYDEAGPEIYHYAFYGAYNEFPLIVSAGVKLGVLFGKKVAAVK